MVKVVVGMEVIKNVLVYFQFSSVFIFYFLFQLTKNVSIWFPQLSFITLPQHNCNIMAPYSTLPINQNICKSPSDHSVIMFCARLLIPEQSSALCYTGWVFSSVRGADPGPVMCLLHFWGWSCCSGSWADCVFNVI